MNPLPRFATLAALCLGALLSSPSFAAINLELVANPNPARPDELLDFELTVTNDGLADRNDVTLEFLFPANIKSLSNSRYDGSCPSVSCEPGELAVFGIAELPAGEGVTFSMPLLVESAVTNGTVITFSAEVFDDAISDATDSTTVTVDAGRELELAIAENRDPLAPGTTQEYTLTYGVIETSPGSPAAVLALPIPPGTSFVSATDGGTSDGSTVEWTLGNLNPGTSGERRVTLVADVGLDEGSIVSATATFFDAAGNSVSYASGTRVQAEIPLRLQLTASPDPVRPDEIVDLELTVANDGFFNRTGVTLQLEIPDHLASFSNSLFDGSCPSVSCEFGERATFDIGVLPAGTGRTFSIPLLVDTDTIDGIVIPFEADLRDSTGDQRESGVIAAVREAREVELTLVADHDPVPTDEAIDYVLTYGVLETSAGSPQATLRLPAPAGTSFLSASDSGTFTAGVVEWQLGNLDAGSTGERRASFAVDGAVVPGTIVEAEATFDDAQSREVRYEVTSRVMDEIPLQLDVIASPDPARPQEVLDVELTVTNRGTFDRTDIVLRLEFPDDMDFLSNSLFDGTCPSTGCLQGQRATFDVGTLPPGEGRSFTMPMQVDVDVLDGTTIAIETEATDSTGVYRDASTSLAVDDTRNLDLALVESDEPLAPGDTITYTMTFGTFLDGGGALGTRLEFEIPDGTLLISVSDGGLVADGVVSWAVGGLNPGAGGDRSVLVQIDPALEPATIIEAEARFDDVSSPVEEVRFEEATRIGNPSPFDVDLDIAQFFALPNTTLDLVVSVTNRSAFDRSGVVLRVETPEGLEFLPNGQFAGSCPSTGCLTRERAVFNIAVLAVGETVSFTMPYVIDDAARAGTVINFDADASDDTGFIATDGDAVLVGDEFDGARSAGAGVIAGGVDGEPLRITKADACDDLILTWGDSCLTADADYAIYAGTIGDYTVYDRLFCSTGGLANKQFEPAPGADQFFLVVPQNGLVEGSYGRDDDSQERLPSASACLPQLIATTCE